MVQVRIQYSGNSAFPWTNKSNLIMKIPVFKPCVRSFLPRCLSVYAESGGVIVHYDDRWGYFMIEKAIIAPPVAHTSQESLRRAGLSRANHFIFPYFAHWRGMSKVWCVPGNTCKLIAGLSIAASIKTVTFRGKSCAIIDGQLATALNPYPTICSLYCRM